MKFKSYKSEVVDVAEKGIVTIAISKFNSEDMGGDIVRKGAFMKTFKEDNGRIKHVIDHQLKASAIIGLPIKMYESDTHAVVESALNLEKEISRDVFSDYKFFKEHGKSLEHSFGYLTTKQGNLKLKGEEILELKMYEYTTTAIGMMADTPLLSLKTDDIMMLEDYLRKYDVSNKKGKQIEEIILKIKQLKEPSIDTLVNEPTSSLMKLNELMKTKNIFN